MNERHERRPTKRPVGAGAGHRAPRQLLPAPDAARKVAFDLLRAVESRDAFANLVLPRLIDESRLDGRDAAFATELGYGTLRSLGTYDEILQACIDRPIDQVDGEVREVLRLGAHQLLGMRTPAHAAVSTTVDLCRAVAGPAPGGFVNAVLRKVSAHDLIGWTTRLAPDFETDPAGHLAFRHAHPAWIVRAFADALGGDWEQTAQALAADNVAARVTLVARPGRATRDELLAHGAAPTAWSPYGAVLAAGDPGALAQIRSGAVGVQDEGSQLVALALADARLAGPDACWLDSCAGPGGKSALLAGMAAGRGARLLAADLTPHRSRLVADALGAGSTARIVTTDSAVPPWRPATFDRVLVDAPCSGLGSLRRRPEARWRRVPADIGRLFALQTALLGAALDSVRPGGVVGYATCSPHLTETAGVVHAARVAASARGVRTDLVDATTLLPGVPQLGAGPYVQLWPHRHGTDAMFLALLRRLPG